MNKSWTLEVQQHEDGDYFIELPDEAIAELGWKEGDSINWVDNKDGTWSLKKINAEQS